MTAAQTFIDQLTVCQDLWTPELLKLLGVEDALVAKCIEVQRKFLLETKQANLIERVKIGNDEVISQLIFTDESQGHQENDDPFFHQDS